MSWRCVPSPQSTSRRSPPRRTSVAERPRRGLGEEPAVPRKSTSRSMAALSCRAGTDLHQLERQLAAVHAADAHRVGGCAAALRGASRVEDLEAVAGALVEREVRMAEHN